MSVYLDHFGLREPPFRITPDPQFFFGEANRGPTLEALQYAILNGEGLVKIIGEVGSGKTMLCRVLSERLPKHVDTVYIANPSLSRDEIVLTLAHDLGLQVEGIRLGVVLRSLQNELIERHAQGRQTVVLIDEAHAMPDESLEEIRLLSNLETTQHKLLQLVLFAQPELDERLDADHMRQLRERITFSFEMPPLQSGHVARYLEFRMRIAGHKGNAVFGPLASRIIASASLGLIRRINILAEKALLSAFAAGRRTVSARDAWRACHDSRMPPTTFLTQTAMTAAVGVAVAAVAAMVVTLGNPQWLQAPAQIAAPAAVPAVAVAPAVPAASVAAAPESTPSPSTQAITASSVTGAGTDTRATGATATAVAAVATTGTTSAPGPTQAQATPTASAPAATTQVAAAPVPTPMPAPQQGTASQPRPAPALSTSPTTATTAATPATPVPPAAVAAAGTERPLTIQLMYATRQDDPLLRSMRERAVAHYGDEHVFVVPARVAGQDAYALCVQRFSAWSEGDRVLREMPADLKRFSPQIRSVERLRRPTAGAS